MFSLTFKATRVLYQTAPSMLTTSPVTFQNLYTKSPKANAPITVSAMFFMLPATPCPTSVSARFPYCLQHQKVVN